MSTFTTKKTLLGSAALSFAIADRIKEEFKKDGYEVSMDSLSSGGYDISITKGGLFRSVLGTKTALKVTLLPQDGDLSFEAGIGIWGQQAIPTAISMLFFWPVIITQIWGIVKQSSLDDKALSIAENVVIEHFATNTAETTSSSKYFCPCCGAPTSPNAKFCPECGAKLQESPTTPSTL